MKTLTYTLVFILVFAFIAQTRLEFKPFKIYCEKPYYAIGWMFMIVAIILFELQGEKTGEKRAYKEIQEAIKNINTEKDSTNITLK